MLWARTFDPAFMRADWRVAIAMGGRAILLFCWWCFVFVWQVWLLNIGGDRGVRYIVGGDADGAESRVVISTLEHSSSIFHTFCTDYSAGKLASMCSTFYHSARESESTGQKDHYDELSNHLFRSAKDYGQFKARKHDFCLGVAGSKSALLLVVAGTLTILHISQAIARSSYI